MDKKKYMMDMVSFFDDSYNEALRINIATPTKDLSNWSNVRKFILWYSLEVAILNLRPRELDICKGSCEAVFYNKDLFSFIEDEVGNMTENDLMNFLHSEFNEIVDDAFISIHDMLTGEISDFSSIIKLVEGDEKITKVEFNMKNFWVLDSFKHYMHTRYNELIYSKELEELRLSYI